MISAAGVTVIAPVFFLFSGMNGNDPVKILSKMKKTLEILKKYDTILYVTLLRR